MLGPLHNRGHFYDLCTAGICAGTFVAEGSVFALVSQGVSVVGSFVLQGVTAEIFVL